MILPVDQGFEHGPARSFAVNPDAYDPHYHYQLAIDAGLSAYAAPLGMIEAGAGRFAGQIPTIMKVNSSNSLAQGGSAPTQAITGSVSEALRLGCSAIGFTIYPGSDAAFDMMGAARIWPQRRAPALPLLWSYPRGGGLSKSGETALDIVAMPPIWRRLGAHIIKVMPPLMRWNSLRPPRFMSRSICRVQTLPRASSISCRPHSVAAELLYFGGAAKDRRLVAT